MLTTQAQPLPFGGVDGVGDEYPRPAEGVPGARLIAFRMSRLVFGAFGAGVG
jgi:hypothetical protein